MFFAALTALPIRICDGGVGQKIHETSCNKAEKAVETKIISRHHKFDSGEEDREESQQEIEPREGKLCI